MRLRGHRQLTLAVETGGGVGEAVQAAHLAGVEQYEMVELGGLPIWRVLGILGQAGGDGEHG